MESISCFFCGKVHMTDQCPDRGETPYDRRHKLADELYEFVIQYLYSEHGICAPHHDAAPYSPHELKDMAQVLIAKIEG